MVSLEVLKQAEQACAPHTICRFLLHNVTRNPEKTAVVMDYGRFEKTYAEFLSDVASVGSAFYAQGFRGKTVALVGSFCYPYLLALIALLCSNAIVVPLDPTLPAQNVRKRLNLIEADAAICDVKTMDMLGVCGGSLEGEGKPIALFAFQQILDMLECKHEGDWNVDAWANDYVRENSEAMMLFSSGTGGIVKAAVLTQRNLTVELEVCERLFTSDFMGWIHLPAYHIIGIGDLIAYLFWGSTIYVSAGFSHIFDELQYIKPAIIKMVPAQAEFFAKTIEGKSVERVCTMLGGNLRSIRTAGAPLPDSVLSVFREYGIFVTSEYGMTEVAGPVSIPDMENGAMSQRIGSVGSLIPGIKVRIDNPTAAGHGEILLSGYSVFSRYYGNSQATCEAFCGEWYRTGDLGYVDNERNLFVVGRKKNLIILSSGENIIPEEIEAELLEYECIQECRVFEKEGKLAVELFSREDVRGGAVMSAIREYNRRNPSFRQLNVVDICDVPLKRTSTGKLVRS